MWLGLRAVGSAVRQLFSHLVLLFLANVTGFIITLPLVAVILIGAYAARSNSLVPIGIVILIGVLPNPALAGLHALAHDLAKGDMVTAGDQWTGLRRMFPTALRLWLPAVVVTAVIVLNIAFYSGPSGARLGAISAVARIVWGYLGIMWIALHLYVYPLAFVEEQPRLVTTYRNALVLTFSRPVFSLTVGIIWLALLSLTAATALATVIGLALGAVIQHNALARILSTARTL